MTGNNSNMFTTSKDQHNHVSVTLFSDKMKNILQSEQADLDDD